MDKQTTVSDYMTQQPQSIEFGESLEKAGDMMSKYGIRHLPVTKKGKLVGILSERELNLASGIDSFEPSKLLVADVCSENPYVVEPETPLWKVAGVMADKAYGSALVMENGKLAGIFTTVDACRALHQVLQKAAGRQKGGRNRILGRG